MSSSKERWIHQVLLSTPHPYHNIILSCSGNATWQPSLKYSCNNQYVLHFSLPAFLSFFIHHFTVQPLTYHVHPQLQENYTGVETARLWNWFFLPFLAETKREWLFLSQVYCKICPHSFQFALFWPKLLCFPVKSVVNAHNQLAHDPWLLILLEKHSNLGQNNANWKL